MIFLHILLLIVLAAYAVLLLWLATGYIRTGLYKAGSSYSNDSIRIIVCARNEQYNLSTCLKTIAEQERTGPLHLHVINDASDDHTGLYADALLCDLQLPYTLTHNKVRKGKKKSLRDAIQQSDEKLIITRDADTYTRGNKWLGTMTTYRQEHRADMVIGPVVVRFDGGLMNALQSTENNILAVLACGSSYHGKPFLSSGANLGFTKDIFDRTGAYSSHIGIESGDDVLFMEDVRRTTGTKIAYVKSGDAIVYTHPCRGFGTLLKQKARWASKSKVNPNKLNLITAVVVLSCNIAFVFAAAHALISSQSRFVLIAFICVKLLIDLMLLFISIPFFGNRRLIPYSLPVMLIYPFYAVVVGFAALSNKGKWK